MQRKTLLMLGITLAVAVPLALGVGAVLMSRRPAEVGLIDGRLRACPSTPNCVCSEDGDAASIPALSFEGDPAEAFRSLVDFLGTESNATIVQFDDGYLHVVYHTPVLRFADDVEFRLDPAAQAIQVRSASRVGHSDLGANRARIERLRREWRP